MKLSGSGPGPSPRTPASLEVLLGRARDIAGLTIGELGAKAGHRVPRDLRHNKGFVGQLVEYVLGAHAGSDPEPDFPELGVELKTLPLSPEGRPHEATYVCHASMAGGAGEAFATSHVGRKLCKVLFVPVIYVRVQGAKAGAQTDLALAASISKRTLGMPFLWQRSTEDEAILDADFQRLSARIRLGEVEDLRGSEGVALQLRAKGANAQERTQGVSEEGWQVAVKPRAWYLRRTFTEGLVARAFGAALR